MTVGRAINPMLVEDSWSVALFRTGGALFGRVLYDDRGEPLSVTWPTT